MVYVGFILAALCGYLLGSIPSGLIVGRIYKGIDIRQFGSGKTGATNVLRTLGKGAATVVILADLLKGVVAILLGRLIVSALAGQSHPFNLPTDEAIYIGDLFSGLAAIIGHGQSIWARILTGRWSGGRSVLVGLGVVMIVSPIAAIPAIALGAVAIAITRYVSLGSITGAFLAALTTLIIALLGFTSFISVLLVWIAATMVIVLHKDNIQRILTGTERKIGQPSRPA